MLRGHESHILRWLRSSHQNEVDHPPRSTEACNQPRILRYTDTMDFPTVSDAQFIPWESRCRAVHLTQLIVAIPREHAFKAPKGERGQLAKVTSRVSCPPLLRLKLVISASPTFTMLVGIAISMLCGSAHSVVEPDGRSEALHDKRINQRPLIVSPSCILAERAAQ